MLHYRVVVSHSGVIVANIVVTSLDAIAGGRTAVGDFFLLRQIEVTKKSHRRLLPFGIPKREPQKAETRELAALGQTRF